MLRNPQISILPKHLVPEEKRKRNVRVNGSPTSSSLKLAIPEAKRKRNGSVNGGTAQNTGPEEKRKKNVGVNGGKSFVLKFAMLHSLEGLSVK